MNEIDYIDPIELFIKNESDNIYYLMCDLKNRFYYFLDKIHSGHLLSLILDSKFNLEHKSHFDDMDIDISIHNINKFINKNDNELDISFQIINNYLYKFKCEIKKNDWLIFCYKYTTLSS